jgi:hypothetical protein
MSRERMCLRYRWFCSIRGRLPEKHAEQPGNEQEEDHHAGEFVPMPKLTLTGQLLKHGPGRFEKENLH